MAQRKIRISWRQEGVEKTFLETCIHEISQNGREGGSLKQASWRNIAEKLKTEHNFIVDQRQMKNRYDYLKAKFAAWTKLKNKTGNVYNPVTNTFNLSEEQWELEMKSNKYVETLRSVPLPFPDLCVQLFEGSTSNGFDSWGPSSTPTTLENVADQNVVGIEDIEFTHTDSPTQNKEDTRKDKVKVEKRKDRETLKAKFMEVGDNINKVAKMLVEKQELSNDMGACMDKLMTMGWEIFDAKYQTALLLFGESPDIRRVWLLLQPETCELWVKNAGAKYGLF